MPQIKNSLLESETYKEILVSKFKQLNPDIEIVFVTETDFVIKNPDTTPLIEIQKKTISHDKPKSKYHK